MRRVLADTNLWLRFVDSSSPEQPTAANAIEFLSLSHELLITPQNLIEFWAVATRPRTANGLGWTVEQATRRLCGLGDQCRLLTDTLQVFEEWLRLVQAHRVCGKQVHDARIASIVIAHGLHALVSFNTADFRRYPLQVIHPLDVGTVLAG